MNKKRFSLNSLLQNGKFLFVLSVLISIAIWMYMSLSLGNDTSKTISNIPVQIDLSDEITANGLQIFSGGDAVASVTVSGNRATVGALTQSDIAITASGSIIDSSGTYSLSLTASKTNPYADYQIVSAVTPSTTEVFVDYPDERTFDIQDNNIVYKVANGYYASTTLSTKSVTVSGPLTEVSKISKVVASAAVDNTLSKSTEIKANIVLYDADGKELSADLLSLDYSSVDVSISVLPEKNVTVNPLFVNKPSGLELTDDMLSVNPSSILIAGPDNVLNGITSVSIEAIDFSILKNERKEFKLSIDIPTDCKNISNESSATVILDLRSLTTKTLTIEQFAVQGLTSDYTAGVTQKSMEITVVGPKEEIDSLNASDITAVIDTSDSNGMTGSVSLPVTFNFKNAKSCWVYGSYKANLTINEK